MKSSFVLAIDQGTTGTRALLFNQAASQVASAYQEFRQIYPRPGWVEHDPQEIWKTTLSVISKALRRANISSSRVSAIGITNQRETTVLWNRKTGKPVSNAIVWQDRRTTDVCERLKKRGVEKSVRQKTGLVLDPYFSGTKIKWMLDHIPGLRQKASRGQVLFGTIDTWLLWKLTGGACHQTDFTNASRTLLYNIRSQKWDSQLLKTFGVPRSILPEVTNSGDFFGKTVKQGALIAGIPIHSMIGDQQAALYGQGCYKPGEIKNTYGTGCFVVMNAGSKFKPAPFGLLSTLACDQKGHSTYALEGSIFIAGAAVQWLRDGLHFFKKASETERMISKLKDSHGVTVIPAFAGLGSPYWNPNVRGLISGLTRGVKKEHIIRATLESLAHQSSDVMEFMSKHSRRKFRELKVDGGATANQFLMQFQADLLQAKVCVSDIAESTGWGAAKLAGYKAGVWSLKAVDAKRKYKIYRPKFSPKQVKCLRQKWHEEVKRSLFHA